MAGSWRGKRSGVQILPPPEDAPRAPFEMAEHPFILEYPVKVSDLWPITNFRRMREHRQFTFLLNVLLAGGTTIQPRRPRHLWAIVQEIEGVANQKVQWVQEFYFANFGEAVRDELSPPAAETLEEVDPETYYATVGHDGRGLRVPADLDDSICCYMRLSKTDRDKFDRAGFWIYMASRQWTVSFSASFASLAIAVESLGARAPPNGEIPQLHRAICPWRQSGKSSQRDVCAAIRHSSWKRVNGDGSGRSLRLGSA